MAAEPLDLDRQLMLRLQRGDQSAFRQLLERNGHRVLNFAYRYFNDRSQAEDVVQETFLKIYQARERYRPEAPFQAYMLRIATNVCLSQLRKKKPVSMEFGKDDSNAPRREPASEVQEQPGAVVLKAELHDRVRAAVDQLPERQRVAILLNKFEGMDYQGVADQLELSVPAVKSLLHRARMALKDLLSDYLEEQE